MAIKPSRKLMALCAHSPVTSKTVFFKWKMIVWKSPSCHLEKNHHRESPEPALNYDISKKSIFVGLSF